MSPEEELRQLLEENPGIKTELSEFERKVVERLDLA